MSANTPKAAFTKNNQTHSRRRPVRPPLMEPMESRVLYSATAPVTGVGVPIFGVSPTGNLYMDKYNSSMLFSATNYGNPGVALAANSTPAYDAANGNIYAIGSNGMLYVDHHGSSGWNWYNQSLRDPTCVLNGQTLQGSPSIDFNGVNGNVYVVGTNGVLYADNYNSGSGWQWTNQSLRDPTGVLSGQSLQGSPSSAFVGVNGNVYVIGTNGTLYADNYSDTSGWQWCNQSQRDPTGILAGQHLQGSPSAAFNGFNGNVYVIGTNGVLYADNYYGGNGWSWTNQTQRDPTAVLEGQTLVGSPSAAFNGDNGNVYCVSSSGKLFADNYGDATGWQWTNQSSRDPGGIVPNVTFSNSPRALIAPDFTADVFVKSSDGTLFDDHFSPTNGWQWASVGNFGEPTPTATVWGKAVKWKNFSNEPLFGPGGPSANDIFQGQVGDCWFMASLSATAKQDPNLIRHDVTQRADGTYDVYFHKGYSTVDIHVDGELPVDWWGNTAYAGLGHGNCTWVAVMEKAFTYFRNQSIAPAYPTISSGNGFEAFNDLGALGVTEVRGSISDASDLYTDTLVAVSRKEAVDLGISGTGPLEGGHEYTLIGARYSNSGGFQLEVRNPWGFNYEWAANNPNYDSTNDGYVWVNCGSVFSQLDEFVTASV